MEANLTLPGSFHGPLLARDYVYSPGHCCNQSLVPRIGIRSYRGRATQVIGQSAKFSTISRFYAIQRVMVMYRPGNWPQSVVEVMRDVNGEEMEWRRGVGKMSALDPILQNTEASMPKTSRAVPL